MSNESSRAWSEAPAQLSGSVITKMQFMTYPGEPEIIQVTRGTIWNYMVKSFEIDRRDLGPKVVAKFMGRVSEPGGLEFVQHPSDTGLP